jgi:hypothetical protein
MQASGIHQMRVAKASFDSVDWPGGDSAAELKGIRDRVLALEHRERSLECSRGDTV